MRKPDAPRLSASTTGLEHGGARDHEISTPPTIQANNSNIAQAFETWAAEQFREGARLILLEGMPHAGKSTIIKALKEAAGPWLLFELDEFLQKPVSSNQAWHDAIALSFPFTQLEAGLAAGRNAVIEGPAVGLLLPALSALGPIRRAYVRRISLSGGAQRWIDCIGILDHANASGLFMASIYRHHGSDEPWKRADVIFDRLDKD